MATSKQALTLPASSFGSGNIKGADGSSASGARPLLVALVDDANTGSFPHTASYYQTLVFGTAGTTVSRYFSEVSSNKFTWSNASVGHVVLDGNAILAALLQQLGAAFFKGFDTNHDNIVTTSELGILAFYNSAQSNGQTNGYGAAGGGVTISTRVRLSEAGPTSRPSAMS